MGKMNSKLVASLFGIALIVVVLFTIFSLYEGNNVDHLAESSVTDNESTEAPVAITAPQSIQIKPFEATQVDALAGQPDLSAISELSREREQCLSEARSLVEDVQNTSAELDDLLNRAEFNTGELQRVMKYLVDTGIIDFHQAATAMDYFYIQSSSKQLPSFTQNEMKNMSMDNPIKAMFFDVASLIKSEDKEGLLAFWEKLDSSEVRGVSTGKHKAYKLGLRNSIIRNPYTIDALVASVSTRLQDTEFSRWMADNISFDASGIVAAIEQKMPDELIIKLIDNSREKSLALANSERAVSTPLLSAAIFDREVLVAHLLQANKFNQPPMAIPPNNRYLAKALLNLLSSKERNQLDQKQIDMLTLFSSHQRPLAFVRDSNGKRRLLGFPFLVIDEAVVDQLRENKIAARMLTASKYPDESDLPNVARYELPELAARIIEMRAMNEETDNRCVGLMKQQSALMPVFKDASEVDEVLQEGLAHQQAIGRLKAISPVLVDLYYKNTIVQLPKADQAEVDLALAIMQTDNDPQEILSTISKLGAHQQHHLSIALCDALGGLSGEKIIEAGLFVDEYASAFSACFFGKGDTAARVAVLNYAKSNDGMLSRIYKAVSIFDYSKAIELMQSNYPSHGFEHGRDALALLLDHILSQSDVNIEQKNVLLEQLLGSTKLQDMHYRRLHRLKLKWPAMYQEMLSKFDAISVAEDYPLSRYNSY